MRLTDANSLTGGMTPIIIAGPCSIESEEQALATARAISECGVKTFRAGVWKPRTRPGCFEGLGDEALEILKKVKSETGMEIAVEVANAVHVNKAVEAGVDIVWLGARTTGNPFAVQEVAEALKDSGFTGKVLVKNPAMPDLELWIGAFMRLRRAGITNLMAVHRGFSTYGKSTYRNPPHWELVFELRRRLPDIKILHDPSHTGGSRDLILPLSQQALDMQFDGLMIESHCCPEEALSDASQQITPAALGEIIKKLKPRNEAGESVLLSSMRQEIDNIDEKLLDLIGERMEICRQIGELKWSSGMSVVQNDRYSEMLTARCRQAERAGISPEFMRRIMSEIHKESVAQQLEVIKSKDKR